jgi:FdhE protein
MSADEIVARGAGEPPPLRWPVRSTVFAERAMRLAQLARGGHAMGDFLAFMGQLATAQQAALTAFDAGDFTIPDAAAIDRASLAGTPPLAAAEGARGDGWHRVLRGIVSAMQREVKAGPAADALARLSKADAVFLDRQADALLTGVMVGLDLATAPIIAAALQVVFTHGAIEIERAHRVRDVEQAQPQPHQQPLQQPLQQPIGRLDDPGICPCCGTRPVASVTRTEGGVIGQRYLHCGLCNLEWHRPRGMCMHCGASEHIAYHSLERADAEAAGAGDEAGGERAAKAAIQAETCDDCGHYLKLMHGDRDPFIDPAADDLASVTLDLLVAETGKQRHGINLMLLFGAADDPPATPAPPEPPRKPGAGAP